MQARVSWDEALDIIAGEMKRIRATYGAAAIAGMSSSHHNSGNIGIHCSTFNRFFSLLGFTDYFDNPDSWEGWMWGFYWRMGPPEQFDMPGFAPNACRNIKMGGIKTMAK